MAKIYTIKFLKTIFFISFILLSSFLISCTNQNNVSRNPISSNQLTASENEPVSTIIQNTTTQEPYTTQSKEETPVQNTIQPIPTSTPENLNTNTNTPFKEFSCTSTSIDLNRDGISDSISYNVKKGYFDDSGIYIQDSCTLSINNLSVTMQGYSLSDSIHIVDIDSKDSFKEIVISDDGPNDVPLSILYYYNGKNIIQFGRIDFNGSITANGTGIIKSHEPGHILYSAWHECLYRLTSRHSIEKVPQNEYKMDLELTVKKPISLFKSKESNKIAVSLKQGDVIKLLSTNDKEWCFAQSSNGIQGWFSVDGYNKIRENGLDAKFVFEGLDSYMP